MLCDAHCHPFDLFDHLNGEELENCLRGVAVAASSWNREQFEYHESLALKMKSCGSIPPVLCFAVHPQFPACSLSPDFLTSVPENLRGNYISDVLLPLLESLAREKRLGAIGEAGFDLFNDFYRNTEKIQDEVFAHHIDIALKYDLPVVLHVRKAMHKIFTFTKELKKLPAVIFHSWRGTTGEGEAMLRRGINAYFSFGTGIINNHKQAQAACVFLPPDRLLLETDAPYMPLRGKTFSAWTDLPSICMAAANLRKEAGVTCDEPQEIEMQIMTNFTKAFGLACPEHDYGSKGKYLPKPLQHSEHKK